VECRKPCRCSVCHRFINPGDKAFKTSQWLLAKQRYHRTTYCDRCYRPEVGQVVS
jgi:ferredoxin